MVGREPGEGVDEDVEALARREPSDAADDVGVVGQAEAAPGVPAGVRVEAEAGQVDAVGDDLDPGGGDPQPRSRSATVGETATVVRPSRSLAR